MSMLFIPVVAIARYFGLVKFTRLEPVSLKNAEAAQSFEKEIMDTHVWSDISAF